MKLRYVAIMLATTVAVASAQTAQRSIEVGDLKTAVSPCDNFYEFANGTWRAQNPIPASMDRWSRRWKAGEENKDRLKLVLDDLSAQVNAAKGSPAQVAGDFYAACKNVAAIDAEGIKPLEPWLSAIDGIQNTRGVQAEMNSLAHFGIAVPFRLAASPNLHSPNDVIADIDAEGLGLPDRDYYVKTEKRFVDARAGYLTYVAKILQLSGLNKEAADAGAKTILDFETQLAKSQLDNVELRDPHATDHIGTLAELKSAAPHFDWNAYFTSAAVTPGPINLEQPKFMAEFDKELASAPLATWKLYLRWTVVNAMAPALSEPFVQAHFDFYQKQLAGVTEMKPREVRCAVQVDTLLGEASGQEYVKRYFPPVAKQRAVEMVTNIKAAMRETLEGLTWMAPETKTKALEKLSTLQVKVGYPDKWLDYASVHIQRSNYFADVLAAQQFDVMDDHRQINKPVDRNRFSMTAPTSDASYNPLLQELTFPAGILQPPAFSADYVDAVNYGAIGVVIGHEISHGFDDQGAQFDAQGRLNDWWTPADLEKFHAKTGCVARQFDGFTLDDSDIHINGKLVLGESIADLAGLKISYLAFKKTPQGKSDVKINGFTPDQQFFIAWGQFRGDQMRPEAQKLMVQGDPHPLAKYRVLGPMSNFQPFATAFGCKADSKMVRPDNERCVVW